MDLQQSFLNLRFGMFLHFNMATFQNLEWGDPREPISTFNPSALDTDQWISAGKAAGMTYACLTTKEASSITMVLQFGLQEHEELALKPLMSCEHIRRFCITKDKVDLIKSQLTELLTDYGIIDLLIFDGWNAPWSRITYDDIPFHDIYRHVKTLQPNCLVMDLNASEFPGSALYYTDIKAFESNAGQALPDDSIIPAQCCHTLTNEWFWKQGDETKPLKSADQVVHEWLIPQNDRFCNLLLNAPPNREGRLSANVVDRLHEIGQIWSHPGPARSVRPTFNITTPNLALCQPIFASASQATFGPDLANDGVLFHSWCLPPDERAGWLEIDLTRSRSEPVDFNTVVLSEPVGRWSDYPRTRIGQYRFLALVGEKWIEVVATPGINNRETSQVHIHRIPRVSATRMRLEIKGRETEPEPHVAEVGVYDEPDSGLQ